MDNELITSLGRSGVLGLFRPLLDQPSMRELLGEFLQFHVIVDTNVIVSDLYFLTRVRRKEDVQPTVKELLASKTIIGYFPLESLGEVDAKCRELSGRYGIQLDALVRQWQEYRAYLRIVPTAHVRTDLLEARELRDPTDLPFVQARHVVGAEAVLTRDADIAAASVPVIPKAQVLLDLRDYARNRAVRVAVVLGTTTAVMIPIGTIFGLVKLLRSMWERVPRGLLLGLGALAVFALLHPKSREFLFNAGKGVVKAVTDCAEVLGPTFSKAFEAASQADVRAATLRDAVEKKIGRLRAIRPTLAQAIYRVCLLAPAPMAIPEIWAAVSAAGFKSRARNPLKSVSIAVRRHPLLARCSDERWGARAGLDRPTCAGHEIAPVQAQ